MFESFKAMRRIEDLEERFSKLKRDFDALALEWENAYDKLRSMMQRVAKRAEVAEKGAAAEPEQPSTSGNSRFSARQQEINAQILARRNRGVS